MQYFIPSIKAPTRELLEDSWNNLMGFYTEFSYVKEDLEWRLKQ